MVVVEDEVVGRKNQNRRVLALAAGARLELAYIAREQHAARSHALGRPGVDPAVRQLRAVEGLARRGRRRPLQRSSKVQNEYGLGQADRRGSHLPAAAEVI